MPMIAEPLMAMHVCFAFVFWFVFKISRKRVDVPEEKEQANEEPSFLFPKEGPQKLCKNQLTHAIWKNPREKNPQQINSKLLKRYTNARQY